MTDITNNLKIPLILGTTHFSRDAINTALNVIDTNALNISHAKTKAHWEMWKESTIYAKGDVYKTSNTPSWGYWQVTVAGTSGTTEPTETTEGAIVTDGTCKATLFRIGQQSSGISSVTRSGDNLVFTAKDGTKSTVSINDISHASMADTATKATSADSATEATHATSADSATNATHATSADTATKATSADSATKATTADKATTATTASTCTGNSATATKLATARTIALSGAATGTATSFDGSGNITIPVTSLDASKLSGTASINTTGNAATATHADNVLGIIRGDWNTFTTAGTGTIIGGEIHSWGDNSPTEAKNIYPFGALEVHVGTTPGEKATMIQRLVLHNAANTTFQRVRWVDSRWQPWVRLANYNDITDLAPTKTGSGASGTWGISITGNAATATKINATTLTFSNGTQIWVG